MSDRPDCLDDGVFGLDYIARLTLASDAIAVTALCQTLSEAPLERTPDRSSNNTGRLTTMSANLKINYNDAESAL